MMFNNARLRDRRGDLQNKMNVTLMMILLAFFIVLNSMSVSNSDKRKAALGSLIGTLGILPGGTSPMTSTQKSISRPTSPMMRDALSKAKLMSDFENYAIKKKVGERITTIMTNNGLKLTIDSEILFKENSASLNVDGMEILDRLGKVLAQIKGPFVIEGHTDKDKVESRRFANNLDLSIAQAGSVARYFIGKIGVKPEKFSIMGYGALLKPEEGEPILGKVTPARITIIYKRVV